MSIYMTVYKCICMYEYIYVCMYCMRIYMCAYIYVYMHVCIYVCTHVCIHACIDVIFKLGFEQYGGIVLVGRGNCPGELSISRLLKRYLKAKRNRAPAYSRAL